MRKYILFTIFALLLYQISFSEEPDKTELLNRYLKKTFNLSIKKETHYYIFINLVACRGCIGSSTFYINKIKEENKSKVTVIACFKSKKIPDEVKAIKIKNILYDKRSKFFTYDINPRGDALIKTVNNKIEYISDLNEKSIKEVNL